MKARDLVKACREYLGMTPAEFAIWAETTPRSVRRWEVGEHNPPKKILEEITRVYNDIGEGAEVSCEDMPRIDTQTRAESALLGALNKATKPRDIVALSEELRAWRRRDLWQ